jgi:hypothetical protein
LNLAFIVWSQVHCAPAFHTKNDCQNALDHIVLSHMLCDD